MNRSERQAGCVRAGPLLTVEDVSVALAGRTILSDVNFTLAEGELAGLIGANGAGKTTLFRVILGLLAPRSGRVVVQSEEGRGRPVSYLPQKVFLDPDVPLRARDLVGLGLDGHRLGVPWPNPRKRRLVAAMLEEVGASALADERVGRLSGGEQQRVLIAHALVSRPRLLLLDEPLANLDLASAEEVVSLLVRLCRERNVTAFVSTHDMNPLVPVMDRVVYVGGGRAASGTAEEVINSEALSRLYGRHVDVLHVHGRVLVVAGQESAMSHSSGASSFVEVV